MTEKTTLLLMVGGWGRSKLERSMAAAHRAAARDLLDTLLQTELIDRAVVATDDPTWKDLAASLPIEADIDPPGKPFHFGQRLAGLIERYGVRRALYSGGASAPLLGIGHWQKVLAQLGRAGRQVTTNNVHSSDWAGFTSAQEAAPLIAQQVNDNGIAWVLANEAGWQVESMPPSAATRFDLDTPTDLLIAQRHPNSGANLRKVLDGLRWEAPQLDGVMTEMGREGGSLAIAGRVSEAAWTALNRATHCWVRVFAEERGMRASGRQERGEVRSLLADYLETVGTDGFFDEMANLANGLLLDSRVILVARGLWPSKQDRFNSDLHCWEEIENPFLRRFTQAAAQAQIPVMLGGHSVVAGGLMALVESLELKSAEAG